MPTKSRLSDLNDHLFAQMERLSDEDLEGDDLQAEILRSKAVGSVADKIISNARLVLDGHVAVQQNLIKNPSNLLGMDGYKDDPL